MAPNEKTQSSPAVGNGDLATLRARLLGWDERRSVLIKQIIALEKTSGDGRRESGSAVSRIQELLDGKPYVLNREKPISQLDALYVEYDTLGRAIEVGW